MPKARIKGEVSLDGRKAKVALQQSKNEAQKFKAQMQSVGRSIGAAFSVGVITTWARRATQLGSEMSDLALQSGLTTDEYQALELAMIRAGVSGEKMRTAMSRINITMGQAQRGMKTYIDLYAEMGISQEEIARSSPAEILQKIAEAMTNAERGSSAYGAALELLGSRSAAQLTEVMEQLANEGLQSMIDKGKEAGEIIDQELIKQLDQLEDQIQITQRQLTLSLGTALIETKNKVQDLATEWGHLWEAMQRENVSNPRELGEFLAGNAAGNAIATAEEENKQRRKGADGKGDPKRDPEAARRLAEQIAEEEEKARKKKEAAEEKARRKQEAAEKAQRRRREADMDAEARILQRRYDRDEAARKKRGEEITSGKTRADDILSGKGVTVSGIAADEITRMGGSAGTYASPELRIAERTMQIQTEIRDLIKDLGPDIGFRIAQHVGLA